MFDNFWPSELDRSGPLPELSHLVRNQRAMHPRSYGAKADWPTFSPLRTYEGKITGGNDKIIAWAKRQEKRRSKASRTK